MARAPEQREIGNALRQYHPFFLIRREIAQIDETSTLLGLMG